MIELWDDYIIVVDQYNYIFGRRAMKKTSDGSMKESYSGIKYFSTLSRALEGARVYFIKQRLTGHQMTLREALAAIREADEQFEQFIKENIPDV